MVVADHVEDGRYVDVLLVDADPVACRAGVAVVMAGGAGCVLAVPDEVELVPLLLSSLAAPVLVIGSTVRTLSSSLPPLTDTQALILRSVVAGGSNADVAATTGVSVSTVKRELARLRVLLGVSDRRELQDEWRGLRLAGVTFDPN